MRIWNVLKAIFLVAAAWLVLGAGSAFAQFDDLLLKVPGGANALVLIDVDAVYASPMAVSRGWKASFERKWAEQPILLPPEAKRFVLASHLAPLNNLKSEWEAAVVELGTPIPVSTIARAEGGYVDTVDSTPVVWTPSHAYIAQLDDRLLAIAYPDDRQMVARWLNLCKTGQNSPLSPYLKAAAKKLRSAGEIVMAVDLSNVAQPHKLDRSVRESDLLKGKNISPMVVAQILSSLKGVTVTIDLESQARTEARVDFGGNIRPIKSIAKDLVLHAMSRVGIPMEDSQKWKFTVDENSITMRGILGDKGLRLLSSFLELPTSKFSTLAKESESKEDPRKLTIDASLRYFHTFEKLIEDLKGGLNTDAKIAWYEKTARKIDQMPILHVDDELLAFGAATAKQIRDTAENGRNIGRANTANQVAAVGSYGNYYDNGYGNGYGGYYSVNGADLANYQIGANNASSSNWTRSLAVINNGIGDMRRKMTKKYQVEF